MPNWCNNIVELSHADKSELERARNAYLEGNLLEYWYPCPKELMEKSTSFKAVDEYTEEDNAIIEKYGSIDGYSWRINNWGTKWDISPDFPYGIADTSQIAPIEHDGEMYVVRMSFDTAWAPAIQAYERAIQKGYKIIAYYIEWGMMFCGKWENGIDQGYDIENISVIPDDIVDQFSIADMLDEYSKVNSQ